jgi:hypothetical protein
MEKRKWVFGEKHPNTLTSMNNHALPLEGQGHQDKAILITEGYFHFPEQVLGPQHPYTTSSLQIINTMVAGE